MSDVYVDYSGTIWTGAMKRTDMPGRQAVLDGIAQWAAKTHGIRDLGRSASRTPMRWRCAATRPARLHIRTLADLAAMPATLKIGGDFEIFSRPEWRSVTAAYGLRFAARRQYQPNLMFRALIAGDVDAITAFSTDGRIAQYGLTVLSDPKGALPPYDAILLVSPGHADDKALLAALKPLIGAIDLSTMQHANLMVDRPDDKQSPQQTAIWLEQRLRRQ